MGKSRFGMTRVWVFHNVKENRDHNYFFVPNNNPQGYREHTIYFIEFDFGEGGTIIDWLSKMKFYVPGIE